MDDVVHNTQRFILKKKKKKKKKKEKEKEGKKKKKKKKKKNYSLFSYIIMRKPVIYSIPPPTIRASDLVRKWLGIMLLLVVCRENETISL